MSRHFNLIRERWLPVIRPEGELDTVSLMDLFTEAAELRAITHYSPLTTISLYRLLLAILYRTHPIRKKSEWEEMRRNGWNLGQIQDYLEKHESRFDLFSEQFPFFQRSWVGEKGTEESPLAKLTHELVSKNNKQIFDHSCDDNPTAFPPAEAACMLLTTQCWALGGGKSGGKRPNFTHGPLVGGVATIIEGSSLRETLLLNMAPLASFQHAPHALANIRDAGTPVWERDPEVRHDQRLPTGIADILTWESRYIRLIPNEDGSVSKAFMVQGEKQQSGMTTSLDPMHAWRKSQKGQFLPIAFRLDRAAWRDATALLSSVGIQDEEGPAVALQALGDEKLGNSEERVSVCIAGLANNQANPQHWTWQRFRVSASLLDSVSGPQAVHQLRSAIQLGERIGALLYDSLAKLGRSIYFERLEGNGMQGSPDREQRERAAKFAEAHCRTDHYWSRLEKAFHDFLGDFENPDRWRLAVRSAALDAYASSTASFELTPRHARALERSRSQFFRNLSHHLPKEDRHEAA